MGISTGLYGILKKNKMNIEQLSLIARIKSMKREVKIVEDLLMASMMVEVVPEPEPVEVLSKTDIELFLEGVSKEIDKGRRSELTDTNLRITPEGFILIWFPEVFRILKNNHREFRHVSKHVLLNQLREHECFRSDARKVFMGDARRVVVELRQIDATTRALAHKIVSAN